MIDRLQKSFRDKFNEAQEVYEDTQDTAIDLKKEFEEKLSQ
jgi:hypothetical protein